MKKKTLLVVLVIMLAIGLVAVSFANSKMNVKVGDEVYVCNCGEDCACGTISMKPGNCSCGKPMVKAKVTKVDEDGNISVEGQKKTYKISGE